MEFRTGSPGMLRGEPPTRNRSRTRKHAREARGAVEYAVEKATDQPEARRPRVDVQAGHAQRVVVVPEGGRGLGLIIGVVGVAEIARVRARGVVEERAARVVQERVDSGRQPPGLGISIAVGLYMRAVNVGHDGHGPAVGRRVVRRAVLGLGWIGAGVGPGLAQCRV